MELLGIHEASLQVGSQDGSFEEFGWLSCDRFGLDPNLFSSKPSIKKKIKWKIKKEIWVEPPRPSYPEGAFKPYKAPKPIKPNRLERAWI